MVHIMKYFLSYHLSFLSHLQDPIKILLLIHKYHPNIRIHFQLSRINTLMKNPFNLNNSTDLKIIIKTVAKWITEKFYQQF